MKIGIYDLYLDALGGGEKYALTIASVLAEKHEVDIFWSGDIKEKAELITGLDLYKTKFVGDVFRSGEKGLKYKINKLSCTKKYDLLFYVTDGSLFFSQAKKSLLIVQVPQKSMYAQDIVTQLKLKTWKGQICYSDYVKKYISQWWKKETYVLPPAIQTDQFKVGKKENIIISVGRFFPLPHSKKQEVMIEIFRKMVNTGLINWKLVLIGGVDDQAQNYLNNIRQLAHGYPIEIYNNVTFSDLKNWYAKSMIYWHAAGFREDLKQYPERAEHFGMTTVEAMASGCVPLVFPAGGQKEIIVDGVNGLYWKTEEDLMSKTRSIINNIKLQKKYSLEARKKSEKYSLEPFKKKLDKIIK